MEVTRDLDKSSLGIEGGMKACLESVQERLEGEKVGTMSTVWKKVRILFVKKKNLIISIS